MRKIYLTIITVLALQPSSALNRLTFDPPSFSYSSSVYCQSSPNAVPVFSVGSETNGVFSASSPGILLDNTTGEINCGASAPGTYVIIFTVPSMGGEPSYSASTVVTIEVAVQLQPIDDVDACAFYILPQIFQGDYYSGLNGTGTHFFAGDPILSTMQMHVFSDGSTPCNSTDDVDFMININSIDISISYDGAAYHANQSGATYQWAVCSDPAVPVPGATTQSFMPTENGDYTVLISSGDCDAYAQCFTVDYLSIKDTTITGLEFGPNPFRDNVQIKSKGIIEEIAVYNAVGQLVFSQKPSSEAVQLNLSKLPNGDYFVKVIAGNDAQTLKLLKN